MKKLLGRSSPRRRKRGFVLVVALFFMMLLGFIGTALIGLLPVEFRSSSRNQLDVQAHYAASAGIRYANTWFTAVISKGDSGGDTQQQRYALADIAPPWGNATFTGSSDIMGVPDDDPDWELMQIGSLQFPASGYTGAFPYIPSPNSGPFHGSTPPTGNDVCGYSGAGAPGSSTYVVASKRPLKLGNGWETWVAFVPHNDQDTPGSVLGGTNNNVIANSRAYQMVAVTFYQGQPYLRAKAMVREATTAKFARLIGSLADPDSSGSAQGINGAEWMLGASKANQTIYEGPVHSNKWLPMSIAATTWTSTNGGQAFKGVLSYAEAAPVASGWNKDDVLWAAGNYGSYTADRRPFVSDTDSSSPTNAAGLSRYEALIKNGKSNIQKTKNIPFPQNSTSLYDAAFGRLNNATYSVNGAYTNTNIFPDGTFGTLWNGSTQLLESTVDENGATIQVPKRPKGLFINYDGSGALGGVYVNGDVKNMFLEVVDENGTPITSTSVLASGTNASGSSNHNAAIRVQEQERSSRPVTMTGATVGSTSNFVPTATSTSAGTPTNVVSSNPTSTTSNYTTNVVPSTVTSSNQVPQTTWSTCTTYTTSSNFQATGTSYSTTSNYDANANGSGNGGWVMVTSTSYASNWVYTTNQNTSNCNPVTGSVWQPVTATNGPNVTVTGSNFTTGFSTPVTTWGTPTVTATLGDITWTTGTTYATVTRNEVWNAIDQAIFPSDTGSGVTIQPTLDWDSDTYRRSAGRSNEQGEADFDTYAAGKFRAATQTNYNPGNPTQYYDQPMKVYHNGTQLSAAMTVGADEIAVLKQSRTDPTIMHLIVLPKKAGTKDGTNGSVYVNGSVNALAGVNKGKRTIAAQNNALDQKEINISDNLLEYGTVKGQVPANHLNGLGLIAEDVNIIARPKRFNQTTDQLNIYAIVMAGRDGSSGGLRVKRLTQPSNSGSWQKDSNWLPPINDSNKHKERLQTNGHLSNYNSTLSGVNDALVNFNMDYLIGTASGKFRNWQESPAADTNVPMFTLFGGLLERQPRIIFNGSSGHVAGWMSAFRYNQELANNPPPFWPSQGTPEIVSYHEERL